MLNNVKFENEKDFFFLSKIFRFFFLLLQIILRDLDHQQKLILFQINAEKDKLENEKQQFKYLFKMKKCQINEFEEKFQWNYRKTKDFLSRSTPTSLNSRSICSILK